MKKKIDPVPGDQVVTKWDDTKELLKGIVLRRYRGHRDTKWVVEIAGVEETVYQDQFVRIV